MNKIIFTALALLFQGVALLAQVKFSQDLTYEQALDVAKKSNKKVFIDFFAVWCGPCKVMDREVFPDAAVGAFMNKEFINLKIDAEKGEGVALAKKFKIKAYPTFVVLEHNGQETFRMEGGRTAPEFLKSLQKGLDPNSQPEVLAQRYANGDRSPSLINDYVLEIMKSGDEKKGYGIINNYFDQLSADQKVKSENLFLYQRYAVDIHDPKIKYLIANKNAFIANNEEAVITALIYRFIRVALIPYANGYLIKHGTYSETSYAALRDLVDKVELPDSLGLKALVKIANAQNTKDQLQIMQTYETEFPNVTKSDRFLLMFTLGGFKDDRKLANRAKALITHYLPEINKESVPVMNKILFELEEKGPSIAFAKLSFQEALDKAKKENKLVFLDCFTDWCGPCKWLDDNTFRDPAVVKHFDANYINLKIDMEKGEGVELSKKLGVTSYPTMFFIDGEGKVLHKVTGSLDANKLLEQTASVK